MAHNPSPGDRNRDVERIEEDQDRPGGDPPEDPSDDDGPDPGNTAAERDADRLRQTLNGPIAV